MRLDINDSKSTVKLNKVDNGKNFLYGGRYYIATDERETGTNNRLCVDLANGLIVRFPFDESVIPVLLAVVLDPEEGAKNE